MIKKVIYLLIILISIGYSTTKIAVYKKCPICQGAGIIKCSTCSGSGTIKIYIPLCIEKKNYHIEKCPQCQGSGISYKCYYCGGAGKVVEDSIFFMEK